MSGLELNFMLYIILICVGFLACKFADWLDTRWKSQRKG